MPLSGKALAEAHIIVRADMSAVSGDVQRGTQQAVDRGGRAASRGLKDAITKPLREGFADGVRQADPGGQAVGGRFRQGIAGKLRGIGADTAKAGVEAGAGIDRGVSSKMRDVAATTGRGGRAAGETFSRSVTKGGEEAGTGIERGVAGKMRDVAATTGRGGKDAGAAFARDATQGGKDAGAGIDRGISSKMRGVAATTAKGGEEAGKGFTRGAGKATEHEGGYLKRAGRSTGEELVKGFAAAAIGMQAIEVFAGYIEGAREAQKASRLTEQVIATTGGAAHVTAADVDELALSISNKTGVDDDAIHSGENLLLTFTGIRNEVGKGNDIFNQATGIVTDMSVALGQDMKSSAIQVGKALNDPIKGVSALQRVGVSFTASQKDQIKTLVQSGHTMEAQKVILAELGREFGGAAAAASTPMDKLRVTVDNLGKETAAQLLPAIDKAATILGQDVVPAVGATLHVMEKIPGPVYAAAGAATALYGAFRVGRAFVDSKVYADVGRAMQFMGLRTGEAAAAEVAQTAAATGQVGANDAAAASATRLGSAMGLIATGAAAAGGAFVAVKVAGWANEVSKASVSTDTLSSSLTALGTAGDTGFRHLFNRAGFGNLTVDAQSSAEALDQFQAAAAIAFGSNWTDRAQRLATFGTVSAQAEGQIRDLDGALANLASHGQAGAAQAAFTQLAARMRDAGVAEADIARAFPQYTKAATDAAAASDAASKAVGYTGSVLRGAKTGVAETTAVFKQLGAAQKTAGATETSHAMTLEALLALYPKYKGVVLAATGATTADKAATVHLTAAEVTSAKAAVAHAQALDHLTGSLDANNNAVLQLRGGETAYYAALQATKDALKTNSRTLDVHTAKGRANRQALDALSTAGLGYLATIKKNNGIGPVFRRTLDQQWQKLYQADRRFGATKAAAKKYADQILATPKALTTKVTTPGMDTARSKVRGLKADMDRLGNRALKITVNADGTFTQGTRKGKAAGGPIDGVSPTPTADNIPIAATAGEHMWSVREVEGAGGHAGVERLRRAARTGTLPRFAAGGGITIRGSASVPSAATLNRVIDADQLAAYKAAYNASGGAGGGGAGVSGPVPKGAGVARWGPMVHRALTARGLAQSLWDNWMRQIATESGGNPNAVQGNIGDINNRTGDLAKGLLQVIGATFRAYHVSGTSNSVFDPWANMNAAMNYARHRYGSRMEGVIGHGHGYAAGTRNAAPGWQWVGEHGRELVRFHGGEQVKSATASRAADRGGDLVRLHPETVAAVGTVVAAALTRQTITLDGRTVAGYVDRSLGRASLSVRG